MKTFVLLIRNNSAVANGASCNHLSAAHEHTDKRMIETVAVMTLNETSYNCNGKGKLRLKRRERERRDIRTFINVNLNFRRKK